MNNILLKQILGASLKNNQLPLWSKSINNGFPVLAEGSIGTFNIFNLIYLKFFSFNLALILTIITIFFLTFYGTYLLCRLFKSSKTAAFFAAFSFTFSAAFVFNLDDIALIQTLSFLPIIYYFYLKFLLHKKIKNLITASFLLCQQFCSGQLQVFFLTVFFLFILINIIYLGKKLNAKSLLINNSWYVIFLILGISMAAVQVLPTLEYLNYSNLKGGLSFGEVINPAFSLNKLLTYIFPLVTVKDFVLIQKFPHYVSMLTLVLCFFLPYLLIKNKKYHVVRLVKTYLTVIFIAFLFSLGRYSPIYFIFTLKPFNYFTNPGAYLFISDFFLVLSAAVVLDRITNKQVIKNIILFLLLVELFLVYRSKLDNIIKPLLLTGRCQTNIVVGESETAEDKTLLLLIKDNNSQNQAFLLSNSSSLADYCYPAFVALPYQQKLANDFFRLSTVIQKDNNYTLSFIGGKFLQLNGIRYLAVNVPLQEDKNLLLFDNEFSLNKQTIFTYQLKNNLTYPLITNHINVTGSLENFIDMFKKIPLSEKPVFLPTLPKNLPSVSDNQLAYVFNQAFYPGWEVLSKTGEEKVLPANLNQTAVITEENQTKPTLIFHSLALTIGIIITILSLLGGFVAVILFGHRSLKIPPLSADLDSN